MPKRSPRQSNDLAAASRRIDTWRGSSTTRRRIPEKTWLEAVGLAHVHGVNRVSEAMRLSHERLKKRVDQTQGETKGRARAPRFVEVAPIAMTNGPGKMSIDLVDGSGRSMTLRNANADDVNGIVAAFFRGDSE